jgi:hypothetical protein
MRKTLAAFLLSAALAYPAVAQAQTASDQLAALGLLGRWSVQCGGPASAANPHIFFERASAGTGAHFRVEFGAARPSIESVESARLVRPGVVALRTTSLGQGGLSFDITLQKEPARMRAVRSVGSDGKFYIRDGRIVHNGKINPWQNRCIN